MASRGCSGVSRVLVVWSALFCASVILTSPGVGAFRFLNGAKKILSGHFGLNMVFNCSTDDPNATVSLLFSNNFGFSWTEKTVTANKLTKEGQVFTLLNLIVSDAGSYACKATNQSGQTIQWPSLTGMLLIGSAELPSHFVLIPRKAIIVMQGQDGQVICECEGASIATLRWQKETASGTYEDVPGSMVSQVTDKTKNIARAILKITNAKLADGGVYKCKLTVHSKTDYKLMTIRVDAPTPPLIEDYDGKKVIKEGSEKVVKCIAKASPKPDVAWYRNGKFLNTTDCAKDPKSCKNVDYEVYSEGEDSRQHTTYTKKVLKIRRALYPRDQGEFKCVASNGVPPPAELVIDFDIQVRPSLVKEKNQPMAPEGKGFKVSCSVEKGNPPPTFKWQYQNMKCTDASDPDCQPDESQWAMVPERLMITPSATPTNKSIVLVESDQGQTLYRCQAFNNLGNDSRVIRFLRLVKDQVPLEVDTAMTKTEHNEGDTLQVFCIDRCHGYCLLDFTKDGKRISPESDPRVNVTYVSVGQEQQDQRDTVRFVLTVKNLMLNDSGNYTCVSSMDPTLYGSINITIKGLVAPRITYLTDRVDVREESDDHVQLFCEAKGNPKPGITWYFYKNGEGKASQVNKEDKFLDGNLDDCKSRRSGYFYIRRGDSSRLVICNPEFGNHQGKYQCRASSKAGSVDNFTFVDVKLAPVVLEPADDYTPPPFEIDDTLNVTCRARGNPSPNITWVKNSTGEIVASSQTNSKQLIIPSLKEEDFGVYYCIASNSLKSTVVSVTVKKVAGVLYKKSDGLSTGSVVGIAVGVGAFVLIVLVICCVVYRRQKKQIDEYKQLYFLQQSDYKIDPDRSLLEQCNDLPYDPDWEFPEERLILGNILGAGAFGQVVQAEAIGILALNPRDKSAESFKRRSKIRRSSRAKDLKKEDNGGGWKNIKVPVAVKTLKEGATQAEYKDLASELKILIHLGQHKNIVNLLGACTRGKRLMVIMEFAPHGSLLSFLRGKRDTYEANWTKTMNDPDKEFTLVDLAMIGFQISRGMAFLASKKCVHRDLAARNILVGDDYVMKIADFGLARDIYKDDLYVKKTQGLLPVKWMAPESLFDRIYTEKTDVWSFGILLWETFTLGGTPYPGLPTEQLLDYLSEGKRMDMPAKCPLEVYTVMRDCWIHEADQRPHFTTLNERLAKILERNTTTANPYLALQMEEEAEPTSGGYYLQPADDAGIRESKRYVKSPVHSPTSDTNEPPQFGDAANADREGAGMRYDSPLPTLPPGLPIMSDEDIPNDPLPPLPPSYENATSDGEGRTNSAGGESGIDVNGDDDDGYVDDARANSPFLPPPGNKPVAIEMDKKVPEAKVLIKGRKGRIETQL